jgi:hypothetical protein
MLFMLFRYGLLPAVFFCVVVVGSMVHIYGTHAVQKATWPRAVATVTESQDLGDLAARWSGTPNTFPDPHGSVTYVVDGATYTWEGRGREIGVTVMTPGDRITITYNPKNPRDIGTLVLLGAFTGGIIFATALAFLVFYVWFFWVRRFLRRRGPDDFGGGLAAVAINGPARQPSGRGRAPTFGKR